jgi:large subunit ribosomal protein L30e
MVDIDRALLSVSRTGRVTFGAKRTNALLKLKRVKLVVLSANCPGALREELEEGAKMAEVPIYHYAGTSLDLGEVCGKPFPISAMGVREPGDSDILSAVGVSDVE